MTNLPRIQDAAYPAPAKLDDLAPTAMDVVRYDSPPAVIDRAARELESALSLRPDRSFLQSMVSRLGAAYPPRSTESDADLRLWVGLIAEELNRMPPWAIAEALPELWRSMRWRPSVADVVTAVREAASAATDKLGRLRLIEREQAERAEREAERRRRQEEDRKWLADRETAFVAQFSDIGAETGDFTFVAKEQRPLDRSFPWLDLIEIFKSMPKPPSEPWPRDFGAALVEASIIGRACKAAQQDRADYAEVNQVQAFFVSGDKAAARALANDMAARPRRERIPTWGRAA
jgi:hypothetical protein